MSSYLRVQKYREQLFLKTLHLKKCKKELALIFPKDFTLEDLLITFKECYPYLWERITYYCYSKEKDYNRRKKQGLRTSHFFNADQFLLKHLNPLPNCSDKLTSKERLSNREKLRIKGLNKLYSNHKKLEQRLIYVQEICPKYIQSLISMYYYLRKIKTLDVNIRYLILLEVSHFKCKETLYFLYQINACEKNNNLREFAFLTLQAMGEQPWLTRSRKGVKKQSHIKLIDLKENPTELLKLILKYQAVIHYDYDIFLSHSFKDAEILIKIKNILNRQGYAIYIDWINDKEMLNRENQDENTWNVLFERLNQSRILLYIMTDNCIMSESTEKEVRYFKDKNKKIYYYIVNEISLQIPKYLSDCEQLFDIHNVNV